MLTENRSAQNFLKQFFAQDDFHRSQFPSMILKGALGSGRTHLLHIFANKVEAEFIDKAEISSINFSSYFTANRFYILEDINEIADEEHILRIVNSAFEAEAFLILSALPQSKFALKDLTSRLKNIFAVEIKNPSEESMKLFLASNFSRRQIKVSGQIINCISEHVERSYEAALEAVKMMENMCEENKSLKIQDVRRLFTI